MSTFENLSSKSTQTEFDKKVLSAVPHLHPYVKHRIFIGETKGILPKNMYKSVEIIDEAIAKLYQQGYNIDAERMALKLELFKIVDRDLENLLKKEAFHKDTVSTNKILKEELDRLREDFTMDADLDLILNTELDDISYKQDTDDHVYVYSDMEIDMVRTSELGDLSTKDARLTFKRIYSMLPMHISNIMDLHTFGKLEFDEIATLRDMDEERIKHIIATVRKRFSDYL